MESPGTNIMAALDINPQTRDWTAKVRVLEKPHPRIGRNNPVKFQRLIFEDGAGTKIQASIFGDEIELFQGTFELLKTYHVSNATVKPLDKDYRIGSYVSQWIINPGTLIEDVIEDDPDLEILPYVLASYRSLRSYITTDHQFDLIGAVVSMKTPRIISSPSTGKSLVREATILNEEMVPVSMSFWGPFAESEATELYAQLDSFPVFIGVKLKATSFGGMSLSTRPFSTIIVNPNLMCAHNLRAWCQENKDLILSIAKTGNLYGDSPTSSDPNVAVISKIEDVVQGDEVKSCMIKGIMSIENFDQEVYYTSCGDCRKVIHAKPEKIFHCFHCNQDGMISKMRVRFDVQIKDDSGSMTATLYGDEATNYFMLDPQTIMDHATKDRKLPRHIFSVAVVPFLVTVEIRLKQTRYQKFGATKYYVANIYDEKLKNPPSKTIRERPADDSASPSTAKKKLMFRARSKEKTA